MKATKTELEYRGQLMPYTSKEKIKEYGKEYKLKWRTANPELVKRDLENLRDWQAKNKVSISLSKKEQNFLHKTKAMMHYSPEGIPICRNCGEQNIDVLCIDHINGGGNKERKNNKSGVLFYLYLAQKGYPEGYQVLCCNCNMLKRLWKDCNVGISHFKNEDDGLGI